MAGRPTKLTPELQAELCRLLEEGQHIQTACALVGLPISTFNDWVARGEGKHPKLKATKEFSEFSDAIKRARASAETVFVDRIKKAGEGGAILSVEKTTRLAKDGGEIVSEKIVYSQPQWQADAWYLERSYPDRWGRIRQDVNVRNITKPSKPLSEMTDEELDEFERGLTS
jgi:transposase